MMGVLTLSIGKTSTCLTTFTCPDLTPSVVWMSWAWKPSGSAWSPIARSWRAGSPSPMSGVVGVGAKGRRGTRSRAG